MGRFRAVRSRAFLSFHDIKHTQDPTFIFFSNFFPKILHYIVRYIMWDSVAMHQRIHEFLHPAPIGILSAHELSLLCWVLRDAVIVKPTKTMQQITACKHTHRKTHSDITHGYTLWMHACSSTARECIRLSEHALLTHPSIIRLWHTHRHTQFNVLN